MEAPRPDWAVRAIIVMVITAIFFRCVAATNHSVGGDSGWDLNSSILAWSAATTLQVGDYIVFNYLPVHDVLEVNRTDFSKCHTVNPIRTHSDGETVIHLNQPGARYFICGRLQHCLMGLKLRIQVLQRPNSTHADAANHGHEDYIMPRPRHPPSPSETSPPPSISSGVGELMRIKSARQLNWLLLFFITPLTFNIVPSFDSLCFFLRLCILGI